MGYYWPTRQWQSLAVALEDLGRGNLDDRDGRVPWSRR